MKKSNPMMFITLLILASLLSLVTSAAGIWTMFGDALTSQQAWIAALLLSALLMAFINQFWAASVSMATPWFLKPICFALAVGFSLTSGLLASGSYLMLLGSKTQYEQLLVKRDFSTVTRPTEEFSEQFRSIEVVVQKISLLSEAKLQAEQRYGTSCPSTDGRKVAPGFGKRSRMRERIAREAADNAKLASELAHSAAQIAWSATPQDRTKMIKAYLAAKSLVTDSRLNRLKLWLRDTLDDFETGFVDPIKGRFECPDSEVRTLLTGALSTLSKAASITLPNSVPIRKELSYSESVRNSYRQVASLINAAVGISTRRIDAEMLRITAIPLTLALIVEVVIIVLALIVAVLRRPTGIAASAVSTALSEPQRRACQEQLDVLNALTVAEDNTEYLFVPVDGDDHKTREVARILVHRWKCMPWFTSEPIALDKFSDGFRQRLTRAAGNARYYEIWRLPKPALHWRRQAALELSHADHRT